MYNVSEDLLNYINSSLIRSVHSKIEVDGVELDIKEYPQIEHTTQSIIGSFPVKTCTFTVFNRDGSVNLNGKEVSVSRGIDVNGSTEWIPLGLFTANDEDITTSNTAKTITFKGSDRGSLFDVVHNEGDITYPITLGEYVKVIASYHGVELESDVFPLSDLELSEKPNFNSDTTDRELISRAAELGGCIAYITRGGKLRITAPTNTGIQIPRHRYGTLSCENSFGPVGLVVLARGSVEDNVIYGDETEDVTSWKITDNPYVDFNREDYIESVYNCISGRTIIPFKIENFIDDFIFDLNDVISVQKKDGSYFDATVLSITTSSRIKSNFSADVPTESNTDTKIAGSVKEQVKNLYLKVDYNSNEISSLVSRTEIIEENNSTLTTSLEELTTATEKAIEVGERYYDGVTEVKTKTGFIFDADGLHIEKTDGPTSSVLDETGLEVADSMEGTIFFAGYDAELGESNVKSKNITVEKYLIVGKNSRFEDYQGNRTGCFFVGGDG